MNLFWHWSRQTQPWHKTLIRKHTKQKAHTNIFGITNMQFLCFDVSQKVFTLLLFMWEKKGGKVMCTFVCFSFFKKSFYLVTFFLTIEWTPRKSGFNDDGYNQRVWIGDVATGNVCFSSLLWCDEKYVHQ